uniref:60S acidic ribosomal protein P2 n=1 Tax=Alexandrium andersonii TaxID=327968 RepID=A0A7S2J6U2_9DINO|mmetsp:Transcript_9465/g.21514  ORF Transcript_9465/g.21514 Transcript_9465/m.21514 type:complete len:117 (+) Transcript_9465:97-447(+)
MAMKYLGAYLLAVLGGKESPSSDDIKAILEAGGIDIDESMISKVCERMDGKQAHELISTGFGKFAACGGGGGGGGGAAAPAAGGGGGGGGAAEEKKEEKKVEEEEEEEDMEFDLFG